MLQTVVHGVDGQALTKIESWFTSNGDFHDNSKQSNANGRSLKQFWVGGWAQGQHLSMGIDKGNAHPVG